MNRNILYLGGACLLFLFVFIQLSKKSAPVYNATETSQPKDVSQIKALKPIDFLSKKAPKKAFRPSVAKIDWKKLPKNKVIDQGEYRWVEDSNRSILALKINNQDIVIPKHRVQVAECQSGEKQLCAFIGNGLKVIASKEMLEFLGPKLWRNAIMSESHHAN